MSEKTVSIVELPVSRVVSVYGFGEEPEMKSHEIMHTFIESADWDKGEIKNHRFFGFNNPDPSPGSSRYGYEHWITIGDTFAMPRNTPEGVSIKEMEGGLYASLTSPGIPNPEKWGGVVRWINGSEYQYDESRQWLEEIELSEAALASLTGEPTDPESFVFHLLSPIIKAAEKVT